MLFAHHASLISHVKAPPRVVVEVWLRIAGAVLGGSGLGTTNDDMVLSQLLLGLGVLPEAQFIDLGPLGPGEPVNVSLFNMHDSPCPLAVDRRSRHPSVREEVSNPVLDGERQLGASLLEVLLVRFSPVSKNPGRPRTFLIPRFVAVDGASVCLDKL